MKIYINKVKESWIIDRVRKEWYQHNKDISTNRISSADTIWVAANWVWKKIPKKHLESKKVLNSVYHIDFSKFTKSDEKDFYKLDKYVDEYHVISKKTQIQLEQLTDKKITSIPFWVNQNIWYSLKEKSNLRKKYGFNENDWLVGSFQRDTEGSDLITPKLIKGPDIFFNIISKMHKDNSNLRIVLSGTRRQYLVKKLEDANIPFKYFEMASLKALNDLYNILDLYLVTSRLEGGPQAILECAHSQTPILSTDVGVASEILHESAIFNEEGFHLAQTNTEYAYKKSLDFVIPAGMQEFVTMFQGIYES